ncbi:DUF742 domain-containing protein [Nocardia cyriacigeorgica]|jgi:hypothetical protein|uniref:Protein of uncharacterized function (DUF742) n=1 Tax=Nocardia cyriacigeorgica TaxID=135487 RepID=A0A2L2JTX0_9NOCA|nr:DUF742 domain-containing protein [Nocardia cyriacigeorgica]AVH23261.1 DUF742 domain-containing protein [Nocardia cyriacigeorgica]MBF6088063.1 DUF742 domain-containing protein [Nocardia cyriacigeorgica]MBF6094019.1 DUF742 domain-containing protein [Nocardia cyriacigeorgica]MBF6096779.1 DUF742 domain-containing protein [Nocardia cyriacigeorgica]MBF6162599.1 DUF742 domain-containing protein [Nocardia cyriacigeorgica]
MSGPRRDPDLVRAYVRTRGRSRPTRELDLVTLVVAVQKPGPGTSPDARRVAEVCARGALSIAEIAAYLDLPPSVVKILAADLLDTEHLAIPTPAESLPEIALLQEVLNGLRALPA